MINVMFLSMIIAVIHDRGNPSPHPFVVQQSHAIMISADASKVGALSHTIKFLTGEGVHFHWIAKGIHVCHRNSYLGLRYAVYYVVYIGLHVG